MLQKNIKYDDFLKTDDFRKDTINLLSSFYTIVKPQCFEGYIYSFFENFGFDNPLYKKQLIFNFDDSIRPRDYQLFDFETKTITLTDDEIEYINNELFYRKLNILFDDFYTLIDNCHRKFNGEKKYSLLESYKSLIRYIKANCGEYYSGKIKYTSNLNVLDFKDSINEKNLKLIEYINQKIDLLEGEKSSTDKIKENKNPYKEIFVNTSAFLLFEKLHKAFKDNHTPLADYSFIFYGMENDGFLLCKGTDFIKFISKMYQIEIDKIDSRQAGKNKRKKLYDSFKLNIAQE